MFENKTSLNFKTLTLNDVAFLDDQDAVGGGRIAPPPLTLVLYDLEGWFLGCRSKI